MGDPDREGSRPETYPLSPQRVPEKPAIAAQLESKTYNLIFAIIYLTKRKQPSTPSFFNNSTVFIEYSDLTISYS